MKVVLLEDIKKVGKKNEIVEVSDGYAQNFLIKQKKAEPATGVNVNEVRLKQGAEKAKEARELAEARALGEELEGMKFTIAKKTGDGGKLYGTLTNIDVAKALEERGYHVDKRGVQLKLALKNIGSTQATLKLHTEVSCNVTIEVISA